MSFLKFFKNLLKRPIPRCSVCGMKLKKIYKHPLGDGEPRCGYDVDYFYQKRVGLTRQQYIQQYGSKDLILEGK